jgi:type II secretory pathway pseudopilin PulG
VSTNVSRLKVGSCRAEVDLVRRPSRSNRCVAPCERRTGDAGVTLTEIIVTIALMGFAVTAVMIGLRTTISASSTDRDHAVAFSWLQAASDEIYRGDRVPCDDGRDLAISSYTTAARRADPPPAWSDTDASIRVIDVEYLGRTDPDAEFDWDASFCFEGTGYESSPLYTQRVTIETTGPGGNIVRTLQMVKSNS